MNSIAALKTIIALGWEIEAGSDRLDASALIKLERAYNSMERQKRKLCILIPENNEFLSKAIRDSMLKID